VRCRVVTIWIYCGTYDDDDVDDEAVSVIMAWLAHWKYYIAAVRADPTS